MTYLLDTNTCIRFLNPRSSAVPNHMAAVRQEEVVICQIVKAELYYGAYKSARRDANLALLAKFFNQFVSRPFDDASAAAYGRLRAELARRGTPIASKIGNRTPGNLHSLMRRGRGAERSLRVWGCAGADRAARPSPTCGCRCVAPANSTA